MSVVASTGGNRIPCQTRLDRSSSLAADELALLSKLEALPYPAHLSKKKTARRIITAQVIERSIHVIRGQPVMLDSELAALYGVTTKQINQQGSQNKERLPEDFA